MTTIRCPACGHALAGIDLPLPPLAPPTTIPATGPLLLRISEAAEALAVSRSTMYQLVSAGAVPVVHVGRSVRIPRAALEQWVATSRG